MGAMAAKIRRRDGTTAMTAVNGQPDKRGTGTSIVRGAALAIVAVLAASPAARAQVGSDRYSSIVVDARTGQVLEAENQDAERHPASLTKMMTLYMTFEALRDRRISLGDQVPVSAHAASMEPSKLGLVPGTNLTVEQAILGLVTLSANDAAAALGEFLGGDEDRFAQMMTLRARALGMAHTTFRNASGLPDPDQWTTAQDLATLARRILTDFPNDYAYFSTPSFVFHRRVIYNHDTMLKTYPGADGFKTGYTNASGHNLVTSSMRGNVRLIGVVLGAGSNVERNIRMATLLDQGFTEMNVPVGAPVTMARRQTPAPSRLAGLIGSAQAAELPRARQAAVQIAPPPPPRAATHWAIQVGTYASARDASAAAANARRTADGGAVHVEQLKLNGRPAWRAQVVGLTAPEAQSACSALSRHKTACFVLRPEQGQIASR
jgi:D-alanyl-D-alanine carboxypeptidase